ncbi:MAG: oxidoreductase [Flavitalea sp.]
MAKTVLVTGASSGIGKATAKYLSQNNYIVYGAARRTNKLEELSAFGVKPITLDVTDDKSIVECVSKINHEVGGIDILINSAGLGSYGALEDVPFEEARNQMEINLFGAARLIQLVLPGMRAKQSGKIINLSSVGGKVALPMGSWYHASKFAIEGLSDSLRNEVKQFGIDVVVVEPGGTKTEMMEIGGADLERVSGKTGYSKLAKALIKSYSNMEKNSSEPIVIAKVIKKAIEASNPRTRYVAGAMAKPMLTMRKLLSDKMFDKLLRSQMK